MSLFSLEVHSKREIPKLLSSQGKRGDRVAPMIYTALTALMLDSRCLVAQAVAVACNRDLESSDENVQAAASKRLGLLATWQKLKYPFAWQQPGEKEHATYGLLVRLLSSDPDGQMNALVHSDECLGYKGLAGHLVKMGRSSKPGEPPIIMAQ